MLEINKKIKYLTLYVFTCIVSFIVISSCKVNKGISNTEQPEKLQEWQRSYDFDMDGVNDTIKYTYSGGAHCCYKINVKLSFYSTCVDIPYLINGGYLIFGPHNLDNFTISDYNKDGVPEIILFVVDQAPNIKESKFLDKKIAIQFKGKNDIILKDKYYSIAEVVQ